MICKLTPFVETAPKSPTQNGGVVVVVVVVVASHSTATAMYNVFWYIITPSSPTTLPQQ